MHFFRRIRQKLLSENRLTRYLIYAIGEILLVVIGILIALGINNWNEARKSASNEAYILSEILNNLKEDAEQLKYIKSRREVAQVGIDNILDSYLDDNPNVAVDVQDFANFFSFERYYPLFNAFEMMKSTGLKLSNKKLATSLSRYYDFEQKKVSQSIKDIESVFLRIVNSKNPIRSNIKNSITGTQRKSRTEFYDSRDPLFKKALLEELISFNDNNTATRENVAHFLTMNETLIEDVSKELKTPRLTQYLTVE